MGVKKSFTLGVRTRAGRDQLDVVMMTATQSRKLLIYYRDEDGVVRERLYGEDEWLTFTADVL